MRYIRRLLRVYQGFVVSGAMLLFGVVAIVFALIPGIRATRELYGQLRQTEQSVLALEKKNVFLASLGEDELRENVLMLLSAVPQEKSVPTIFSTVEGLANQGGVSIVDMSLTSPGSLATGAASRLSKLPFSLTASGSYDQIRAFIGGVNAVRRLFDVTSFDVSIGAAGATQVRLSLAAFYQPLPTNVGNVQGPIAVLSQKEEGVLATIMQYPDVSVFFGEPLTPLYSDGQRDPFAR